MKENQKLWSVSELAVQLGIKERQVRSLVEKKQIETIRVGRLLRFNPKSVEKWLEQNTTTDLGVK